MYLAFKHIHLTAIVLSLSLFMLRFVWTLRQSPQLQKKWVKILPHVIDTVLLGSAIALCILIAQYPFVSPWVTEKVIGVTLYIIMGLLALKLARNLFMRWVGFTGALAWLIFTAKVAVLKQPLLFG